MSQHTLPGASNPILHRPMVGRDPTEPERAATPLELLFDLVFVVAVALAAERLHHAIVDGFGPLTLLSYAFVFFGIWWAWVNVTWFASAYDTDDIAYRLSMFVMMSGALILAAGVPRAFDERDFSVAVIGYVVMRISLVTQWLRVAHEDRPRRTTGMRFALGVTACQIGWLASVFAAPDWWLLWWLVLAPAELLVPVWAENAAHTTWHPGHIAERYGLFMIIVLGESVLAASMAIQTATDGEGLTLPLLSVVAGGLLILFATWWIYYDRPQEHLLDSPATAFVWSYLHLPVFGAVAAVGAGLVVAIEAAGGHAEIGTTTVGLAIAVPVVVFLMSLWAIYLPLRASRIHYVVFPAGSVLVLAAVLTAAPVLAIGLVLAGVAGVKVAQKAHDYAAASA